MKQLTAKNLNDVGLQVEPDWKGTFDDIITLFDHLDSRSLIDAILKFDWLTEEDYDNVGYMLVDIMPVNNSVKAMLNELIAKYETKQTLYAILGMLQDSDLMNESLDTIIDVLEDDNS